MRQIHVFKIEQTRKANNNSQTQTVVWWLPEGRGWGLVKGKGSCRVSGGSLASSPRCLGS